MRLLAVLAFLLAAAPAPAPVVTGLDHVPIAVENLEEAAARFRALGFALKPGRPHENGIRNVHAKFPDGTELELLTAPAARDALTTKYRRFLRDGDGPAFLGLYAPDRPAAVAALTAGGYPVRDGVLIDLGDAPPLSTYFLAGRQRSPTDRPEHFAHANGATSLIGVWLAGDRTALRRLLNSLRVPLVSIERGTPRCMTVTAGSLPEGEIVLLPVSRRAVPGRPIVGVTVAVGDIEIARRSIRRSGRAARVMRHAGYASVFVPPAAANGLWIEFRERRLRCRLRAPPCYGSSRR